MIATPGSPRLARLCRPRHTPLRPPSACLAVASAARLRLAVGRWPAVRASAGTGSGCRAPVRSLRPSGSPPAWRWLADRPPPPSRLLTPHGRLRALVAGGRRARLADRTPAPPRWRSPEAPTGPMRVAARCPHAWCTVAARPRARPVHAACRPAHLAWTPSPRRSGRHVPGGHVRPSRRPVPADLAAATPRGPAHRVGETAGAPGEPPPPRRALRVIYAVRRKAEGATTWENVLCSLRF